MRDRFEQQLGFGILPIEQTKISLKAKDSLSQLLAALLEIYVNPEYNQKISSALVSTLVKGKKQTGRPGMNLWQIFVLAQVRLCCDYSYAELHDSANNHLTLRRLLGVASDKGEFSQFEFGYQNIYDNISQLSREMLQEINEIIVEFGHKKVFKKKESEALRLKTDSFVVESNVHFPTDYNLLWDCIRKCTDVISTFTVKYNNSFGWRKLSNWRRELKGLMRELGKASASGGKNKDKRVKKAAQAYLKKSRTLEKKMKAIDFPIEDVEDLSRVLTLEHFIGLINKHIDLIDRRILKDETIPHEEKLFSVFETYTEWIKKGKSRPSVELGKKLNITTCQYNLIIDYQIMDNQQDRDIVLEIADRILQKYEVKSWSFDKGYWNKDNKQILQLSVEQVVIPKLGKKTKDEQAEESSRSFRKYKNQHSTIESNINELEHRGLDRCPDKGIAHYNSYIALGVCAYNLKKIGKKLLDSKREELKLNKQKLKLAA